VSTPSPAPARTPEPPYWAVLFTSIRTAADDAGYARAADRMVELAQRQPGYLGFDSARGADGLGMTISYWASPEAIARWRADVEHAEAQRLGRERWYASYCLRVCRVERAWEFEARPGGR
jgi:heme-degrading monooxygenase HmoA